MLVTTGVETGVSIEALFTAGLMPALVLAVLLCVMVWVRSRNEVVADARWLGLSTLAKVLLLAVPGIGLPILIRTVPSPH